MLDQDNNFYLISFSILIICLLDNLWKSPLGFKELKVIREILTQYDN